MLYSMCSDRRHDDKEKEPDFVEMVPVSDNSQRASTTEEKAPSQDREDAFNIHESLIASLGIEPERPHEAIEIFIH